MKTMHIAKLIFLLMAISAASPLQAGETKDSDAFDFLSRVEINGFLEARGGYRTQDDPFEKNESVMEARLQAEFFTYTDRAEFKYKGDVWADGITEKGEYDTREAWIFFRPAGFTDVKIGRQILTWGTGDLVFLNDLFPKDWQSYFIGRDKEYLKAPSDAVKASFFTDLADMDLVYTPKFNRDRYITGEYISHWNGNLKRLSGRDSMATTDKPDDWFRDDEIALRVYKNINNYELALYGYFGFWKRPGGRNASGASIFPELNVYGASARGRIGRGIGNLEIAYYHSLDDKSGADPLIDNSEIRCLTGYTQDLAMDFNASIQYYIEYMLDYDEYRANLSGDTARDEDRHVITVVLTKLLMNQNLELSLSSYYSPSDRDAYLRPIVHYKYTDKVTIETGANVFFGEERHTFFSQFENNTNIYTSLRYSF
jgi:hypothetical protein